jgi:hypothetical protein
MYISIALEETYIDKINNTLTVEIYRNWKDKFGEYCTLHARIPSIPAYQARVMYDSVKRATPNENVVPFKPKLELVVS